MPEEPQITKESKLSEWVGILPLSSIAAIILLFLITRAFFDGSLFRFYASALFLFYALTSKMWVSVVMLGIFQTLILIPLRIVRVLRSDHIGEFQQKIKSEGGKHQQLEKIQDKFAGGNRAFLFYLVDFVIQLATFLTIGRLFLTDFYSERLDPRLIYDFIPYPDYPITDTIFKIPYIDVTKTVDLGVKAILIFWVILVLVQVLIMLGRKFIARIHHHKAKKIKFRPTKYTYGYMLLLFITSALLMQNFPVGFELAIFSGDVSIPNRTLNTITAVATFLTLLWFGYQRIRVKTNKARELNVPEDIIDATQADMFRDTMFTATVVGLGAFFITNHIPSAFELSVFTLEIISFFSPFTLDKFIRRGRQKLPIPS